MPTVRLRLSHAATGTQQVVDDHDFVSGEIERLISIQDRIQSVGELAVTVEVPELLGSARKPLAVGRHRATVEVLRGTEWEALVDGTVSNERAAHGRERGGIRRWALTIVDDAAEVAWAALEGVQIRSAVAATQAAVGRYDMGWMRATGEGIELVTHAAWGVSDLTDLAVWAAGLPAATAPSPYTDVLSGVVPVVALCAPRPEPEAPAGYESVPNWTGGQLVEYRCESEQLVLEATYAAWPAPEVGALTLRSVSTPLPEPGTAEAAALVTLDDDGAGQPWHDEYDWSTEPGDDDGRVLDDYALSYAGGPDGSYIGSSGEVLELPIQATYAARRVALSGSRAPGRDGGRTVDNAQHLELPVLLPAAEASGETGTAFQTLTVDGRNVDVSRPVYDNVADDTPDESAVYLVSLLQVGADWRSVVERRGADGRPVHELWARELYPRLAYAQGDAEVLSLTVPAEAVPEGSVTVGDPARGVVCEGLPWIVRSVTRAVDGRSVALLLARPAGADSRAESERPGQGGREELPPSLSANAYDYQDTDDQGQTTYTAFGIDVSASVPTQADTPSSFELEVRMLGGWVRITPVERDRSIVYSERGASSSYAGQAWRCRVRYPSGTVTDWTTTTAS